MRIETTLAMRRSVTPPSTPPRTSVEVWVPGATDRDFDSLIRSSTTSPTSDVVAETAYRTAERVLEYVRREFGRDSFDGRGSTLKLRVHAPDPMTGAQPASNAYWFDDEQRIWLGDGDGDQFAPLGNAADVVAHEFFHGVIDSEVKLRYIGQEGAVHESFADVLATGVDGNWQVGEDVYTPNKPGDAIRDLSNLQYKRLVDLPDWEDEVHAMSEVPSHAAYLVGKQLGQAEMRRIWYAALTTKMKDHVGFAGARDATVAAATVLHGAGSAASQAVIDAWAAVGIDSSTPKR